MIRKLIAVVVLIVLLAFTFWPAPQNVIVSSRGILSISVVYAQVDPDITVSPTIYGFGLVQPSSAPYTGFAYFTLTNSGTVVVDVTIKGTDMTGGTTWVLSDTGVPGVNIVGLKSGKRESLLTVGFASADAKTVGFSEGEQQSTGGEEGQGSYSVIIKKTTPNCLTRKLPVGGSIKWGLKMYVPTGFSDPVTKTGVVTLTATAS